MKKFLIFLLSVFSLNFFVIKTYADVNETPPTLISEGAIIMEANTGTILYEKNVNVKMYPASLTKIASAIYTIETGNLEDIVTISRNARNTEGSSVYLEEEEKVSLKRLVQGLLINSGNDAGVAIAEHLSGSVEKFSNDLNTYLNQKVDLKDTNFENPHGLFDPAHVTTARDLAKITQYAMQNNTFKEIFGTKELDWNGRSWDTTLITHHKILKGEVPYEGVSGGKTGFINQSGFNLATTAKKDDLSLIVITLNSYKENEAYNDTIKLLEYGFENYTNSYIKKGTIFTAGSEKYVASKPITYTHRTKVQTDSKVSNDGNLKIIDEDVNIIASFQLKKVNTGIKIDKDNQTNSPDHKPSAQTILFERELLFLVLPYVVTALIIITTIILYRQTYRV